VLEHPLVARGGDRFVLRSFSPVTTIGGGVVLDPFPPARTKRRQRRLAIDQPSAARLVAFATEAGLAGLALDTLAVRVGIAPASVSPVIADAGPGLVALAEMVVAEAAVAAEAGRLVEVLRHYHGEHPLDPGMSLQALRAAVGGSAPPAAVVDAVVARGVRDRRFEVLESVVHLPGWRPALDARTSGARDELAQRLTAAKWQVPTVTELERELPSVPVRALLAHLARDGVVESMDQERYATKAALGEFRTALERALGELGQATPAELRDRFGLTRKYLIPLLEWADRRGVTRRTGDARVLAPLTAGKRGP
jgi:selenocysteine-specific elongation factor